MVAGSKEAPAVDVVDFQLAEVNAAAGIVVDSLQQQQQLLPLPIAAAVVKRCLAATQQLQLSFIVTS